MNVILRPKTKLLYTYSYVFNKTLSFSRKRFTSDDFYGLVTHGSGETLSGKGEEETTEDHSILQKKINEVDPHQLIADENNKSSNKFTLPYGFIRYDTPPNQEGCSNVDKNTNSVESQESIPSKYDQSIDTGKVSYADPCMDTTVHSIGASDDKQKPFEATQEETGLNFVDEQFFHYEALKSDESAVTSDSYTVKNNDAFDQKDLSFIDHQYFINNTTDSAEVLVDCQSKKFSKDILDNHAGQSGNHDISYHNEKNNVKHQSHDLGSSQMSFIDEQYFDPKLNLRNEASNLAKQETKHDIKKQFLTLNEEKTGITESMFEEAKDFKQVKNVINRYHREKTSSFDGKAYSAVQELRVKKQSSSLGEYKITYDSQGYRILKNQVPHFEHASSLDISLLIRKKILYEGNDIVAINKPYGLPSHGGPGVKQSVGQLLDAIIPSCKLHLVHRLDKETTGVMLLAKTAEMANQLQKMFQKQEVKKRYLAITKGYPSSPKGLIDIPIAEGKVGDRYRMTLRPYRSPELSQVLPRSQDGSTAKTLYRVLDSKNMTSLIECIAITGIKHQIRVHLAFGLNCPILGDHKYAHLNEISPMQLHPETLNKLKIRQSKVRYVPMHLHARSIMVPDFLDGKHLFLSAPLPNYFINNMRSLKLTLPPKC